MFRLEHKIPPPLVVLLVAALMWVIAGFQPRMPLDQSWRWVIACVFGVCGLAVAALGVSSFRIAKTTINPVDVSAASTLVTSGIFAYSRNPMYVGMTALLLGWAFLLAGAWTLLGPIAFAAFITRFQILPEESALKAKFGEAYANYQMHTRRWI